MVALSPGTAQRLEALFGPKQRNEAQRILETQCAGNLPFHEGADMFALERVRFAVLKLSNGNLKQLQREIDQAKLDWRDTLMAAGFGEDIFAHRQWFPDNCH